MHLPWLLGQCDQQLGSFPISCYIAQDAKANAATAAATGIFVTVYTKGLLVFALASWSM
jgi:hypothetical protein